MRVLHVHTDLYGGGIENVLVGLARNQAQRGLEIGIAYMPCAHPEPPQETCDILSAVGVRLFRLQDCYILSPNFTLRLTSVIRHYRPDILHLHGGTLAIVGVTATRLLSRRPKLVYTEHMRFTSQAAWIQRIRRSTDRLLDLLVAVSCDTADSLAHVREKVVIVTNGLPRAAFVRKGTDQQSAHWRTSLGVPRGCILLGSVGLLHHYKGHADLVRALASLRNQQPTLDVRLAIAGDGPEHNNLFQLADELGVSEECVFLGWRDDIGRMLEAIDIYVHPSLTEAMPIAVLEAAARGLPIVATTVGGVPEVLTSEEEGLLVPPHAPEILASAIKRLMDDPAMAARMGAAARTRVATHYSEDACVESYIRLYDALSAGHELRSDRGTRPCG